MSTSNYSIHAQTNCEAQAVDQLLDAAFGLDRRAKSSYRLRESEVPVQGLSFVAKSPNGTIIGTISFWHIHLGEQGSKALLLGPLAVAPDLQSTGIGLALMHHGITAAKQAGHQLIILVGDAPYYAKVGFKQIPFESLLMPGPNNPERLLYLELENDAFKQPNGMEPTGLIRSPSRWKSKA